MKIPMGILSFKQNWEGGVVKRTTALAKRSDSYYAGNDSFGKVSFKMKAK